MSKKNWFILIVGLILGGGAVWGYHSWRTLGEGEMIPLSSDQATTLLQERGVSFLKRSQYRPVIHLYLRMLEKDPENIELKRKLALLYEATGETEKAARLREEIGAVPAEQKNPPDL